MRKLRLMCGHIRIEKIRKQDIQDKLRLTSMVDKMRKVTLKCFGHIKRRKYVPEEV